MSNDVRATSATVKDAVLFVSLEDGRVLHVPLESFPRLRGATSQQLLNFRLIGRGQGIHWPDLDEDLSVRHLVPQPDAPVVFREQDEWTPEEPHA